MPPPISSTTITMAAISRFENPSPPESGAGAGAGGGVGGGVGGRVSSTGSGAVRTGGAGCGATWGGGDGVEEPSAAPGGPGAGSDVGGRDGAGAMYVTNRFRDPEVDDGSGAGG